MVNAIGAATLLRTLVSGNTAPTGAEVRNSLGTLTGANYNLFGHSGLTNARENRRFLSWYTYE